MKQTLEQRFWRKVEMGPGCWTWSAGRNPAGYGYFDKSLAHRVAWELTHGPIPDHLRVMHACDNPPCVNPAHLSLGTQAENLADMVRKGRARKARGEEAGKAKLKAADILRIREMSASGMSNPKIGAHFGVHAASIWAILHRKAWAHIPD